MTEQEKQRIIANVNSTMAMESMPLTETDKQRTKDILDGKITADEAIQNVIAECKR